MIQTFTNFFFLFFSLQLAAQKIKSNDPSFVNELSKKVMGKYAETNYVTYDFSIADYSMIDQVRNIQKGKTVINTSRDHRKYYTQYGKVAVLSSDKEAYIANLEKKTYYKVNTKESDDAFDNSEGLYLNFWLKSGLFFIHYDSSYYYGIVMLNNKPCYKLTHIAPSFSGMEETFYLDTATLFPLKIVTEYKMEIKEYNSISEMTFNNYQINNQNIELLDNEKFILGKTYVEYKKIESVKKQTTLSKVVGQPFEIEGINVYNSKPINQNAFKSGVKLIDFWFINCYPCAEVNRILKRLYKKYRINGLEVVGINAFDDIGKIKNHLKKFNTTYTNIKVSKNENTKYGIISYPTILCVGKNGSIKNIFTGNKNNLEDDLEKFILEELKNEK